MINQSQTFGALSPPKRYEYLYGPEILDSLGNFLGSAKLWLIEFGAVYVNHKRVLDRHFQISKVDVIRVHLEPKRYMLDLQNLKGRIAFENENFLVVDKPSGLPMHPTLDNFYENLIKGLEEVLSTKLFVTHRLDVPTRGLVVLAKTAQYQTLFNRLVSDRKVEKNYEALVKSEVPLGPIKHWMLKTKEAPKKIVSVKPKEEAASLYDECLLDIISAESQSGPDGVYKLKIKLITGRTHQIRAQLSAVGSPIIGDEMYGGIRSEIFGLRAISLAFTCPKTQEIISVSLKKVGPGR